MSLLRWLAVLLLGLILCGCAEKKNPGATDKIRVVSLSPALTETLFHLGGGSLLVGRSEVCDYPSEAESLPVCGGFCDPSTEAVLALKPTHVITNDFVNPNVRNAFSSSGVKVIMKQARTGLDYAEWVALLGREFKLEKAAFDELRRINDELSALKSQSAGVQKSLGTALWIIWDSPVMAAGGDTLPDEVMTLAGLENKAAKAGKDYFRCSSEFIIGANPDYLIWTGMKRDLSGDPVFGRLDAVKNGRVITFDDESYVLRPGPRIFNGIGELRAKVIQCQKK